MNQAMGKEERKTKCNLNEEIDAYRRELIKKLLDTKDQLEKPFVEFRKRDSSDCASQYIFNGEWITRDCMLDLLGKFLFYPPDCSSEHFYGLDGVVAQGRKKRLIALEDFLKKIPGIKLPPRLEIIDVWLNEKEEDYV